MNKKILTLFLILFLIFPFSGCIEPQYDADNIEYSDSDYDGELTVHFIDVGQADSTLLISGGETMLIDGGNPDDSSLIVAYLKNLGITHLDYMVCTHAHDDHVGGLSGPLNTMTVDEVYAPKTESDIKSYKSFKTSSLRQVEEINVPEVGETVELGDSDIIFLGPVRENYDDINDTSVALKAVFGETSFLFTGDATSEAEADMINTGLDLSADVFKVGHHGSSTSNSYRFLREIMPRYAVISCGKGNSYGHPHDETLSRLNDLDAEIYRTDLQGDIVAVSDGKNIKIEAFGNKGSRRNTVAEKSRATEKNNGENEPANKRAEVSDGYIGNKNSKKFHLPTCGSLPYEKNSVYFSDREEATSTGYSPCGSCNP